MPTLLLRSKAVRNLQDSGPLNASGCFAAHGLSPSLRVLAFTAGLHASHLDRDALLQDTCRKALQAALRQVESFATMRQAAVACVPLSTGGNQVRHDMPYRPRPLSKGQIQPFCNHSGHRLPPKWALQIYCTLGMKPVLPSTSNAPRHVFPRSLPSKE